MSEVIWRIRPLSVIETSCLVVLAAGAACANDMVECVHTDSSGGLRISRESARQALRRLMNWQCVEVVKDQNRKYHREILLYRITQYGRGRLRVEIERLADVVAVGRGRLSRHEAAEPVFAIDQVFEIQ
jgi:predicted ArsR family transcriptional regulator